MVESRSVPSCSRRSVFSLFLRLLEAAERQPFTQRTLQEMGVPQYRQGLTLLKGLELITPSGRLQDDVLASRHDPQRFKTLLHGRVRRAWMAAGCTDEELSFLGQDLPGKQLAERLRTLAPINRLTSESARSAARSTLRALCDLLVHLPNREWFENELRALEAKDASSARRFDGAMGAGRDGGGSAESSARLGAAEPRKAPVGEDGEGSMESRARLGETLARTENGHGRASSGETVGDMLTRVLDVQVKRADVLQEERLVIDFTENGDPIYAHLLAEAPWTVVRLQRCARQLQAKAELLCGISKDG